MNNEELAPTTDKILHADGSVTTAAGEVILPADPNRAKEYENRAAFADKWLRSDGSVADSAGNIILGADESRARDYESRVATAGLPVFSDGGNGGGTSAVAMFDSTLTYMVPNAMVSDELELPDILAFNEDGVITCLIRTAGAALEETFNWNVFSFNDTAATALI